MKAIGYDASPRDQKRATKAKKLVCTYKDPFSQFYDYWYPLQEWNWDRERLAQEIQSEGLPVPMKSSCFFCMAMKADEVAALPPDKLRRLILLEARAKPRLKTCEGLWRTTVKGTRKGSTPKPGSMTEFIRAKKLLSAEEIARIQQVPQDLVAFQKAYAAGTDKVPLGVFLNREFPEMYPTLPAGCNVVEVEYTSQDLPLLFEEAYAVSSRRVEG